MSNEQLSVNTAEWHERLERLGVAVIIPTYNNERTLSAVIEGVRRYCRDIIVVNDGSTDGTDRLLATWGDNIRLLTHERNKGKGRALKNGLRHAQACGFRYALTIDSDGQHFPDDIPVFIKAIEQTPDALLVGARNLQADNMPGKNSFANRFSNFWFRIETGIRLTDTQSGYRLYPLRLIGDMRGYTAKYEFELEALVFPAWKGIEVRNIPVHVYYPPEGERVSHFRPLRDFTRISLLNIVLVLIAFLWVWPVKYLKKLTWTNIKAFVDREIIHSRDSNRRITLSIMLGIFMGIAPVWGYQMIIALSLAHLLKLNKLITLAASNISIPPLIPFILYGSYAAGCMAAGITPSLKPGELSLDTIGSVLFHYIIGSLIFATLCSATAGVVSYILLAVFRRQRRQSPTR